MKSNFLIIFIFTALIFSGLFALLNMAEKPSPKKKKKPVIVKTSKKKTFVRSPKKKKLTRKKRVVRKKKRRRKKSYKIERYVSVDDFKLAEIDFNSVKTISLKNGLSVLYGEFILDVGLYRNPSIKIQYAIPLNKDGLPGPNADNIVFHAPHINRRNPLGRKIHKWFTEEAGYTFYSFEMKSHISETKMRDKIYYYRESGFHDLVFVAQRLLQEKFKLKPKKLLINGESAGGTMGQQLGVYYADKIDAVAYGGGHRYDAPQPGNKIAWLSLHCTGDYYRLPQQAVLNAQMKALDQQMLHAILPPFWISKGSRHFHHSPGKYSWRLRQIFLQGIVNLRDANNGVVPNYKDWPVSSSYDGQKWYYPSQEFADAWLEYVQKDIQELGKEVVGSRGKFLQRLIQKLAIEKKQLKKPIYFIPKSKPKAIVIYIHDKKYNNDLLLIDNLYYFMKEENCIAASVQMTNNSFESLKNIENLLKDVQAKKEWQDLPIYVCGLGSGGQLAAAAALRKGEWFEKKIVTKTKNKITVKRSVTIRHTRIKKIITINSAYDWPFPKLSIKKSRKKYKAKIPLQMIFSADYINSAPEKSKYTTIEKLNVSHPTLGKEWFKTLSKIINEK